ncbi:MAG: hypothetical protein IPJ26_16530 [Bacteroidetes bacterium]|nr:hypothetical protein [Bacteroidota bacterium]
MYVDDSSDMNVFNDTIVRNFYGFTRASIPYIESFEGPTTNGWFATSSLNEVNWERGVPSYGTTNSANSGSNVWDIALDTTYKKFQKDTLYSPVFRTIGLNNLQLSFGLIIIRSLNMQEYIFNTKQMLLDGKMWILSSNYIHTAV